MTWRKKNVFIIKTVKNKNCLRRKLNGKPLTKWTQEKKGMVNEENIKKEFFDDQVYVVATNVL